MSNDPLDLKRVVPSSTTVVQYEDIYKVLEAAKREFSSKKSKSRLVLNEAENLYGKKTGNSSVLGLKEVIETYVKMSHRKFDMAVELKNIRVLGFPDDGSGREMKFEVLSDDGEVAYSATTMYQAMRTFLNKTFSMASYTESAIALNGEKIVLDDIRNLTILSPQRKFIFRIISDGDLSEKDSEIYLRAVVSTDRYKLYDNGFVLFVGLMAIDEYAQKQNTQFKVKEFLLTDSKFSLFLLSTKSKQLSGGVSVKTGVQISNSEIADGSVSIKLFYEVSYRKKTVTLTGNQVVKFSHAWSEKEIKKQMQGLRDLSEITKGIYKAIETVRFGEPLDERQLFNLFSHLTRIKKNMPRTATQNLKNLQEQLEAANNAESLFNVFSKLEDLANKYGDDVMLTIREKLHMFLVNGRKWN